MSTHTLCFGAKIRKNRYTPAYPSFTIYMYILKWEFLFFLKSFPQSFLVLSHTLANSFRLCKFKYVVLKFVSQNFTSIYEKSGAKLPSRSIFSSRAEADESPQSYCSELSIFLKVFYFNYNLKVFSICNVKYFKVITWSWFKTHCSTLVSDATYMYIPCFVEIRPLVTEILPYVGMAAILVLWHWLLYTHWFPLHIEAFYKICFDWPIGVIEE